MIKKNKIQQRIVPKLEEFYMGKLFIEAACSRNPEIQHAALVVDDKGRELGFGVDHIPYTDFSHTPPSWGDCEKSKLMFTAEEMAIHRALRAYRSPENFLTNTHLYVTGPPSFRAIRACLSVELKTIIYGPQKSEFFDKEEWEEIKNLTKNHYMTIRPYKGNINWIRDRINTIFN